MYYFDGDLGEFDQIVIVLGSASSIPSDHSSESRRIPLSKGCCRARAFVRSERCTNDRSHRNVAISELQDCMLAAIANEFGDHSGQSRSSQRSCGHPQSNLPPFKSSIYVAACGRNRVDYHPAVRRRAQSGLTVLSVIISNMHVCRMPQQLLECAISPLWNEVNKARCLQVCVFSSNLTILRTSSLCLTISFSSFVYARFCDLSHALPHQLSATLTQSATMTPPPSPLKVPKKRGQPASIVDGPWAKRTRSGMRAIDAPRVRDISPSKNVHFPSNLILGPTEIDPRRWSLSPSRSALRRNESATDSPSFQLLTEQSAAVTGPRSSKKQATTKRSQASNAKRTPREAPKQPLVGLATEFDFDADPATTVNGGHNDVCNLLNKLKERIKDFTAEFPKYTKPDALSSLLQFDNQHLIRYIGLLALGGKGGREAWKDLLSDSECRSALIVGIIGRALKEKVFDELCFGCDDKLGEILRKQEQDLVQKDGRLLRTIFHSYETDMSQVSTVRSKGPSSS